MKNHEIEMSGSCCLNGEILCCCNHPAIDLSFKSSDAAYRKGFCAPGNGANSEYAQDTTAWD